MFGIWSEHAAGNCPAEFMSELNLYQALSCGEVVCSLDFDSILGGGFDSEYMASWCSGCKDMIAGFLTASDPANAAVINEYLDVACVCTGGPYFGEGIYTPDFCALEQESGECMDHVKNAWLSFEDEGSPILANGEDDWYAMQAGGLSMCTCSKNYIAEAAAAFETSGAFIVDFCVLKQEDTVCQTGVQDSFVNILQTGDTPATPEDANAIWNYYNTMTVCSCGTKGACKFEDCGGDGDVDVLGWSLASLCGESAQCQDDVGVAYVGVSSGVLTMEMWNSQFADMCS